jgi:tRNA-specific 2-thiouridylase
MTTNKKKVLVAMSGGVDSSVAAYILKSQGYDVVGVTMRLWHGNDDKHRPGGCCSLQDVTDARRVCDSLGIKHYVLNMESEFRKCVVDPFAKEYLQGRTPNPCITCNETMKFDQLLKKAKGMGFELMATGHYAQIEVAGGQYLLKRGVDPGKDQSYVLYCLTQKELPHILLPLGGMNKTEIRAIAEREQLPVAHKPDSQEICFVEDDYAAFLKKHAPDAEKIRPGNIVDETGKILGKHKGLPYYTIGQRKGMEISHPTPLYVIKMNVSANELVVGPKDHAYGRECKVERCSWVNIAPTASTECTVKIRYLATPAQAIITPSGNTVSVSFATPQFAITPGQSAVFYSNETVVGGGVIALL